MEAPLQIQRQNPAAEVTCGVNCFSLARPGSLVNQKENRWQFLTAKLITATHAAGAATDRKAHHGHPRRRSRHRPQSPSRSPTPQEPPPTAKPITVTHAAGAATDRKAHHGHPRCRSRHVRPEGSSTKGKAGEKLRSIRQRSHRRPALNQGPPITGLSLPLLADFRSLSNSLISTLLFPGS